MKEQSLDKHGFLRDRLADVRLVGSRPPETGTLNFLPLRADYIVVWNE